MQPYTGKGTIDMIARGMVKMSFRSGSGRGPVFPNGNIRVLGTARSTFSGPK